MSNLTVIPPGQRKVVDFVNIVYEGAHLGFVRAVLNAILLEDPEGVPILMEDRASIYPAAVSMTW
jgi:hypothetical protein